MSTDIIKTDLSLIGSYKNTRRADPVGLTMNTDVWRNDVKGGSDGHLILCIRLYVESGEKMRHMAAQQGGQKKC